MSSRSQPAQRQSSREREPGYMWKSFNGFSRRVLAHLGFIPQSAKVCELSVDNQHCRLETLQKTHQPVVYVGAGQVGKQKYEHECRAASSRPCEVHFIEWSGQILELSEPIGRLCPLFDTVITLNSLSGKMRTESEMRRMVEWISEHLRPGGTWIGTLFDSSAIWNLLNKSPVTSMHYSGACFSIEVKAPDIKHFGTSFEFAAPDGTRSLEYLIHLPSLLRVARSYNLHLLEFTNMNDLYVEHSKTFAVYAASYKLPPTIDQSSPLWLPLSLVAVFAFEKIEPPPVHVAGE